MYKYDLALSMMVTIFRYLHSVVSLLIIAVVELSVGFRKEIS